MKAILGLVLSLVAISSQAHASSSDIASVENVKNCLIQYGIISKDTNIAVIDMSPDWVRVEVANKGAAVSGFLANMDIKDGKLFYYDVVADADQLCK